MSTVPFTFDIDAHPFSQDCDKQNARLYVDMRVAMLDDGTGLWLGVS